MKKIKLNQLLKIILACGFLLPFAVLAHNPRIVEKGQGVIKISNPEISQAFYGQLSGEPQWFEFETEESFNFYANILLPASAKEKNVSVEIYRGENWLIGWLDADNMKWKEFHEPFAGDDYWQGEEYKGIETPEVYRLKVYSRTNTEKYVLAVGSEESITPGEFLKTIILLPQLKRDFFEVSPYGAYFNYIGLMILGILMIFGALAFAGWKLFKKIRPDDKNKDSGIGKLG